MWTTEARNGGRHVRIGSDLGARVGQTVCMRGGTAVVSAAALVLTACSGGAHHPVSTPSRSPVVSARTSAPWPACRSGQLDVTAGTVRNGATLDSLTVRVRNRAASACLLDTTPRVSFDNGGDQVNRDAIADPSFTLGRVAGGASTGFRINWVAPSQCQPNHEAPIHGMAVTILAAHYDLRPQAHQFGAYCWVDEITLTR